MSERNINSRLSDVSGRIGRIRHLVRKEFIQIVRNKQNFRMLLFAPVFQLVLFGYAIRLDVKDVPTAVVDLDRSSLSRTITDAFSQSGYFRIVAYSSTYAEAGLLLESGDASLAILIPPDTERRIKGERTARIGVVIDGVDTTTASTVSAYADSILQSFSLSLLSKRIEWAKGLRLQTEVPNVLIPKLDAEPRAWFNPNLDSKDFFVPGIIAIIMTFFSIILTSMAVVRETESGTIEQLMVTPISSLELVLGKAIPCFLISAINLVSVTALAFICFQPPFRGSMVFFTITSLLYVVTCLGLGTAISVFCRTQQQAMLSSFMILQPSVLLSGFVFPIENMPEIVQWITYLNPLRYYIVIVRETFLKGLGLTYLWPQLVPLAAMTVIYFALSAIWFKKRVD